LSEYPRGKKITQITPQAKLYLARMMDLSLFKTENYCRFNRRLEQNFCFVMNDEVINPLPTHFDYEAPNKPSTSTLPMLWW
jgi:hypothetical protein